MRLNEIQQAVVLVAASETNLELGKSGKSGDFLSHLVINPETTTPGSVTLEDGNSSIVFSFGTIVQEPKVIPIMARSVGGPWVISTGADVNVMVVGQFQ